MKGSASSSPKSGDSIVKGNTADHQKVALPVYWARLPGFCPWPARKCSAYEMKQFVEVQPQKNADSTPVVFLGSKKERAWISKNNIFPFDVASWESKFDRKRFKQDRDFRAAVIEGVRVAKLRLGGKVIGSMIEANEEFRDEMSFCEHCGGSEFSGDFLNCHDCRDYQRHWHCFKPECENSVDYAYVCPECCKVRKQPPDFCVPLNKTSSSTKSSSRNDADDNDDQSQQAKPSKRRKSSGKRSSGGDDNEQSNKAQPQEQHHQDTENSNDNYFDVSSSVKPAVPVPTTQHKLAAEEVEERCFVCNDGGELALCDFPFCKKVYHQVCVLKQCPLPDFSRHGDNNAEWFCPRHFCLDCGALSKPTVELHALTLPPALNLYRMRQHDRVLNVQPMRMCRKCPTSLCVSCDQRLERDYDWSFFSSSSSSVNALVNNTEATCQICTSIPDVTQPEPQNGRSRHSSGQQQYQLLTRLDTWAAAEDAHQPPYSGDEPAVGVYIDSLVELARLLERIWSKLCRSRLSVPFMRPFLPLETNPATEMRAAPVPADLTSPADLLQVLEKIHTFQYTSIHDFLADLSGLQQKLTQRLDQAQLTAGRKDVETAYSSLLHLAERMLSAEETRWLLIPKKALSSAALRQLNSRISVSLERDGDDEVVKVNGELQHGDSQEVAIKALWRLAVHGVPWLPTRRVTTIVQSLTGDQESSNYFEESASDEKSAAASTEVISRIPDLGGETNGTAMDVQKSEHNASALERALTFVWKSFQEANDGRSSVFLECQPRSLTVWSQFVRTGCTKRMFWNPEEEEEEEEDKNNTGEEKRKRPRLGDDPSSSSLLEKPEGGASSSTAASDSAAGSASSARRRAAESSALRQSVPPRPSFQSGAQQTVRNLLQMQYGDHDQDVPSVAANSSKMDVDAEMHEAAQWMISMHDPDALLAPSRKEELRRLLRETPLTSTVDDEPVGSFARDQVPIDGLCEDHYDSLLPRDDTTHLLNRLGDLHLQFQQLQRELMMLHRQRQREQLFGLQSEGKVIPFEQAGLVAELKLANDSLRWKVAQRDRLLAVQQQELQQLREALQLQSTTNPTEISEQSAQSSGFHRDSNAYTK